MNTATQPQSCPLALKIIQIINYIAVVSSILIAAAYLFGSNDFLLEVNNETQPTNRYIVAFGYLAIAAAASFVLYQFRKRDKYSPESYILANVFAVVIYEVIYHFSNYHPPLYEHVAAYTIETIIMAYLLLNNKVKVYFGKSQ